MLLLYGCTFHHAVIWSFVSSTFGGFDEALYMLNFTDRIFSADAVNDLEL